jgi:hypothetical protein
VDGDGTLDIACSNPSGGTVQVVPNLTPARAAMMTLGASQPITIGPAPLGTAIADVNQDGKNDLVVVLGGMPPNLGNLTVFRNQGGGVFPITPTITRQVGLSPYGVAVADFNRDGHLDFVVSDSGAADFALFPGDGSGGLNGPIYYATDGAPMGLATGDLDGDGRVDLVMATSFGACVVMNTSH